MAATAAFAFSSCGDDDDTGPPGGAAGGATGTIVYSYVERFDGSLEDAVHVFDVASRAVTVFRAIDSLKGGVSAARDGTLAQLGELDDGADIRISGPDGATRASFRVLEPLSFVTSGAAIAPDGARVAFSFDVAFDDERGARTYVCPVNGGDECALFDGVKSPGWAPDGRLLAVNESQTALFVSNAAGTSLERVGPPDLVGADEPTMTPDGRYLVFSQGDIPHLALLDVATGAVTALTEGGLGQFRPRLSPDGSTLLFQQKCCGGLEIQTIALHAISFTTATTSTPLTSFLLAASDGLPIAVDGQVGWF